jgi:hypothetical protein
MEGDRLSPAELRQAMRARKKELRRQLPLMRKAARERAEQVPAVKRMRERRRRIRRAIGIAIIAILLLLMRCECGPGVPPELAKVVVAPPPEVKPKPKVTVAGPKKPLSGQAKKQQRGDLGLAQPAQPTWIVEFQIQVAARSPRLAQCFTGIDRPGALRWSVSVNPQSGATSDHELEPVGLSTELSPEQRECVVKVLSSPVYKLTAPDKEALPNRVSLVIEF